MLASKRELVLRAEEPLEPEYAVHDEEQRRVGRVFDIFGVVRTPTGYKTRQNHDARDLIVRVKRELYLMG